MAVSFNKSGIINASGNEIGKNLIIDSLNKTVSHLQSGNEYIAIDLGQSYMDIPSGTTVTISFDLEIKYVTQSTYFQVYNTNNKGPKQISGVNIGTQVFGGATVGDTINKRVSLTTTIVDRTSPTATKNYMEFYSTYNTGNVFKVSNLKMELGSVATPWIPNESDYGYIGNTFAFIESGDKMSVYPNHIQTPEFIEY